MTYLVVILAMLADLLTFFCAASVFPISMEANPLARWAHDTGGLLGVAALKVVGTGFVLAGVARLDGLPLSILVGAVVAIGVFGAITNTLAVMTLR